MKMKPATCKFTCKLFCLSRGLFCMWKKNLEDFFCVIASETDVGITIVVSRVSHWVCRNGLDLNGGWGRRNWTQFSHCCDFFFVLFHIRSFKIWWNLIHFKDKNQFFKKLKLREKSLNNFPFATFLFISFSLLLSHKKESLKGWKNFFFYDRW